MAWTLTTDAAELWRRTGAWLGEHAVENAPLLAEVGHLLATDVAPDGLECGWWTDDGGAVGGAYVRAPRHNPLLTRMPGAALDELARRVGRPPGLGVPGTVADDAVAAWAAAGTRLAPARSFTVHVLGGAPPAPACDGRSRLAGPDDRAMLHEWFDRLMAGLPGDPSDRAYVVDDPLDAGALVLWEVDRGPVAMCGRSRRLADTVRMGACYAPGGEDAYAQAVFGAALEDGEDAYAQAVFGAALEEARRHARNVTVLASADDEGEAARLAAYGFVPAATRVALMALDEC